MFDQYLCATHFVGRLVLVLRLRLRLLFGVWQLRLRDDCDADCDFCAAGIKCSAHQSPLNCDNVIKMQTLAVSDGAAEGEGERRLPERLREGGE